MVLTESFNVSFLSFQKSGEFQWMLGESEDVWRRESPDK